MMTTAIVGFKGLSVLSSIASLVILIIVLWGTVRAFSIVGLPAIIAEVPAEPASPGVGITDFFVPFLVFLGVFIPPIGGRLAVSACGFRKTWSRTTHVAKSV